jgi:hypothetical protein
MRDNRSLCAASDGEGVCDGDAWSRSIVGAGDSVGGSNRIRAGFYHIRCTR